MPFFDFADLDRRIHAMALALARRRSVLAEGEGDAEASVTFSRDASSRATFEALGDLGADPFAKALRAWVGHLTLERVTSAESVAYLESRADRLVDDDDPQARPVSVRELSRALLDEDRVAHPAARRLPAAGRLARDAVRRLADRRAEAERLLANGDEAVLGSLRGGDPSELIEQSFESTRAVFESIAGERTWLETVRRSVAADAAEGWPAKLTARWLFELFGRGELFKGVRMNVGRLPEPLGAASFARALAKVGRAWAFEDRPVSTPFCLVRAPSDPLVARRSALFASLVLEPRFHERKLGLGRDRSRAQARTVGLSAVIWLRLAALQARAWWLLRSGDASDFDEASERALGRGMSRAWLGVVPELRPDAGGALRSMLDAISEREGLRDRFDEDWFDNPRAHEALRHENHMLIESRTPVSEDAARSALDRRIVELFG